MKMLVDCVYTGLPSTCSTSYLMWETMRHLAARYDDAFFYLMVPEEALGREEQVAFLNQWPDKVTLLPHAYHKHDRITEQFLFTEALRDRARVVPHSPCWDWDVLLTSRMAQITNLRVNTARRIDTPTGSCQAFIGLEEMPMFSFQSSALWATSGLLDLPSLAAYRQFDGVVMNNLWAKKKIGQVARKLLSPSTSMQVMDKIHEAVPVPLKPFTLTGKQKNPDVLTVAFCGRATYTRDFPKSLSVFFHQFAYAIGKKKIRFVLSTNSQAMKYVSSKDEEWLDIQYNDREKFYKLLETEVDLIVNLSPVEDFSLSTHEPMLRGIPAIVLDMPWTEYMGPAYPFRCENVTQAYALVSEFLKDFEGQYKKFADWHETYWRSYCATVPCTQEVVARLVEAHSKMLVGYLTGRGVGGTFLEMAKQIVESGTEEVSLNEVFAKEFQRLPSVLTLGKIPNYYFLKAWLGIYGYADTQQVGVMRKRKWGERTLWDVQDIEEAAG